jgi:hypothetical protein
MSEGIQRGKKFRYIATLDSSGSGTGAVQFRDNHIHFGQFCNHPLVCLQSGE